MCSYGGLCLRGGERGNGSGACGAEEAHGDVGGQGSAHAQEPTRECSNCCSDPPSSTNHPFVKTRFRPVRHSASQSVHLSVSHLSMCFSICLSLSLTLSLSLSIPLHLTSFLFILLPLFLRWYGLHHQAMRANMLGTLPNSNSP